MTKLNTRASRALVASYYRTEAPATIRAIVAYASQNPGLDFRNYCSGWNDQNGRRAYQAESKRITRDWHNVTDQLSRCALAGVTDQDVVDAARVAFSGRLQLQIQGDRVTVDYCTGQYWPTEYRAACAAVLEQAVRIAQRRWEAENAA